jgi:hypothetical protein
MAGDWHIVHNNLRASGQVFRMARKLRCKRTMIVGACSIWWAILDEYGKEGLVDGYSLEDLDHEVQLPGFGAAMVAEDWLQVSGDGLLAPEWEEYNGRGAKARLQERSKKRRQRSSRPCPAVVPHTTGQSRDKVGTEPGHDRDTCGTTTTTTTTTTEPKGKKTGAATPLVLPAVLDTAEFRSAWDDYEANRKEAGHSKLTTRGREIKLKELADWGHDVAVQSIRESIANGWQGIFKPKGNVNDQHRNGNRGYAASDATERRAAKAAREFPEPDLELPVFVFGGDKRADDSQRPPAPAPRSQAGGA